MCRGCGGVRVGSTLLRDSEQECVQTYLDSFVMKRKTVANWDDTVKLLTISFLSGSSMHDG